MKLISWNVNGINSCTEKGLPAFIKKENADIYCFQEVKSSPEKLISNINNYKAFHFPAKKKGYSGVLTITKEKPLTVLQGIHNKTIDAEGRVLTLEFKKFFLVNAYFPHTRRDLSRMDFKLAFNNAFLNFCNKLSKKKPLIIAADFNVAHEEIDLRNPKQNKNNAGFTPIERAWFDNFLKQGYIDTFREFIKDGNHYTWWTYRSNARPRNIGWRIDYFVISKELKPHLKNSCILEDVYGSDHCPIGMETKL